MTFGVVEAGFAMQSHTTRMRLKGFLAHAAWWAGVNLQLFVFSHTPVTMSVTFGRHPAFPPDFRGMQEARFRLLKKAERIWMTDSPAQAMRWPADAHQTALLPKALVQSSWLSSSLALEALGGLLGTALDLLGGVLGKTLEKGCCSLGKPSEVSCHSLGRLSASSSSAGWSGPAFPTSISDSSVVSSSSSDASTSRVSFSWDVTGLATHSHTTLISE
mmetsp:Transcript_86375/g.239521  ORF Transcript_86375/g.239521 Transcript_86375/m.239521 type:complete len:217 (-) Transcript_86375:396-1046(-)